MTKTTRLIPSLIFAVAFLLAAHPIQADVIADWNAIAIQSTITAARPGATGAIDLAVVHAAMYDAVQAIERRYEPYYVDVPNGTGNSTAAAARAARDVLINRFPSQADAINTSYLQYLMTRGIPETDPGVAVGVSAAAGINAMRACDGSFPAVAPPPFIGGTGIGVWRPTPPANLPMQTPWLANVLPFLMTRPSQFRADPPPPMASRQYAKDYAEVKDIGALTGSSRTPEQTDLAHFYAGNTLVIWNRALRDVSNSNVTHVAESSRLFALAEMAVADALITSWSDKVYYVFWRPITAIREGDNDGNQSTDGDPAWQSLIVTPPYPDYTSGAVNFATAVTKSMEHFFETDNLTFSVTTTNTAPTVQDTRTYSRFSDAAEDVVNARVYSGIHFRFADEAARKQARAIALWGYRNYLRPVRGGSLLGEPIASARY
jgi:hypothetical protein